METKRILGQVSCALQVQALAASETSRTCLYKLTCFIAIERVLVCNLIKGSKCTEPEKLDFDNYQAEGKNASALLIDWLRKKSADY